MSSRRRASVVLCALGLLVTSCSIVSPPAAAPSTTEAPDGSGTTGSSGSSGDGEAVSFADYELAVFNVVNCLTEAGVPITEPVLDAETGQFVFDFDPVSSATFEECDDEFTSIEQAYLDNPEGPPLDATGPIGDWTIAEPDSWVRLLSTVPETTNTRYAAITIVDLERAARLLSVDRPTELDRDSDVVDYLGDLAAAGGIVPAGPFGAFGRSAYSDQMRAELGFDHRDIDAILSAGTDARELIVARGGWNTDRIEAAVSSDPIWSDVLEIREQRDATIYRWGIDFDLDLNRFSPTRPTGQHRRLAVEDDLLTWSRFDDGVAEVLSAASGAQRSLADVDELVSLAAVADDEQLFTGVVTASVAAFVADIDEQRRAEVLLRRPEALLIGDGADEDGRFTLVALNHANEQVAESEFLDFESRIVTAAATVVDGELTSDLEEPRGYEVRQVGSMLIGKIWLTGGAIEDPADALLMPISSILQFA